MVNDKKGRILIAEDESINRMYIECLLKDHYEIDSVVDGVEVLDYVQDREYDLILMDIGMPRINGLEATQKIRESEKGGERHVPIIALTAHAYPEDKERCFSAGMDDFVVKPIFEEKLFSAISRQLDK